MHRRCYVSRTLQNGEHNYQQHACFCSCITILSYHASMRPRQDHLSRKDPGVFDSTDPAQKNVIRRLSAYFAGSFRYSPFRLRDAQAFLRAHFPSTNSGRGVRKFALRHGVLSAHCARRCPDMPGSTAVAVAVRIDSMVDTAIGAATTSAKSFVD